MDLKKLVYFLEIAETLNLSKAAENLHMSQPPLTYQLKALEKELGVTLFERSTRKVTITPAGEQLKSRAMQILELVEITKKEVQAASTGTSKVVRIGFVASSAALLSPEHLIDYHKKYEDIIFSMKEGSTYKVLDLLNHGLIDVGLVRTPFNGEAYNAEYLQAEPMIAVFAKAAYGFDPTISVEALEKVPLVLDKRFSDLIHKVCIQKGFIPNIICEGEDSRSILSWTNAGLGVAILPYSGHDFIQNQGLAYSIIQHKSLETRGAIVTLKEGQTDGHIQDLIDTLKQ